MRTWCSMAGKRERLSRVMNTLGFNTALLAVRRRVRPIWLSVLAYHRVGVPGGGEVGDELYDVSPAELDEQVGHLAREFDVVTTDELIAAYDGAPLPPNPVMITFDDAYLDNLTVALPILQRHGVRATFFVPTDYVERRRLFWWDRIALLVGRCRREMIEIRYPRPATLPPDRATRDLCRVVKDDYDLDLDRFMTELADSCGVHISSDEERALVDGVLMTWDQLGEVAGAGMDIQSHSRSHRGLHTLPPEALDAELRGSRELLEQRIGRQVRALAYPNWAPFPDRRDIRDAVAAAGYRIAFSYMTGPVPLWRGQPDPLDLNRLASSPGTPMDMFRSTMALPLLAHTRR